MHDLSFQHTEINQHNNNVPKTMNIGEFKQIEHRMRKADEALDVEILKR